MTSPDTIRQCLLAQVQQRGIDKTICPSEVARALGGEHWRSLMEAVRNAGKALATEGKIVVTQRGQIVDPNQAKGPIRYRWTGN
ncbi:MAG: DUF3253 domain-containing protein [Leptolyngbya sp. SIO3F4]|nr:DUF3253 domain-containing protein [Leptolyngbya sp. SIO3F4]